MALLLERHPRYAEIVDDVHRARSAKRRLRDAALARSSVSPTGPTHGVLHVLQRHGGGGGTARQARMLVAAARGRVTGNYISTSRWATIGGSRSTAPDGTMRVFDFRRQPDESWPAFLGAIAATFGIGIVHLHGHCALPRGIDRRARESRTCRTGYTAHDLDCRVPDDHAVRA